MKVFHSKRDWWLGLLIWGILIVAMLYSSYQIYMNRTERDFIISLVIWIPTSLLIASIWFFTRYYFSTDRLIIKIGPIIHSEIEYDHIKKISKKNNMKAAPANSTRRIRIDYGEMDYILISPKREEDFIKELTKHTPEALLEM